MAKFLWRVCITLMILSLTIYFWSAIAQNKELEILAAFLFLAAILLVLPAALIVRIWEAD